VYKSPSASKGMVTLYAESRDKSPIRHQVIGIVKTRGGTKHSGLEKVRTNDVKAYSVA